jgi:TonB family protein
MKEGGFPKHLKYGFETLADLRFMEILVISFIFHFIIAISVYFVEVPEVEISEKALEKMSQRFAAIIIPPQIKKGPKKIGIKTEGEGGEAEVEKPKEKPKGEGEGEGGGPSPEEIARRRERIRRAMMARQKRIQRRVRSKGILGIITGRGQTSRRRGSAVVDLLRNIGGIGGGGDLDATLGQITGLKKGGTGELGGGAGFGEGGLGGGGPRGGRIGGGGTPGIEDLLGGGGGPGLGKVKKKGKVKVEAPTEVKGSEEAMSARTQEEIKKEVEKHRQQIMYYYNKELKRNPNLRGKITVRFTIEPNGRVSHCEVISSTMNASSDLEENLVRIIRRTWKFSPIAASAGAVTVVYPFVFVAEM